MALAAAYYVGLGLMPTLTYKLPIKDFAEWLGASRSVASYAYLIGTHTIGVLLAAVPIAAAIVYAFPRKCMNAALLVSLPPVVDLIVGIWMFGGIAEPRSLEYTIFYVTDGLKIGLAVPVIAWFLSRYLPYNKSLHRPGRACHRSCIESKTAARRWRR
ncbi:MAG: hypothetical protein WAM60_20570 [Candidatus Promineifilaceae bacterium]